MDIKLLCSYIDHTNLSPSATEADIFELCKDAKKYSVASVCVAPSYVKLSSELLKDSKVKVCTVIGFPNGYLSTASKCFETSDAIKNGADEIDMVINIGHLKDKKLDAIENEIREIKNICGGRILKVIIETCLLTDEEIAAMCIVVHKAGADFIKTSTGFSKSGATPHAVEIMAKNRPEGLKIKAAGGISSIEDAENFISIGAERLGTSRIIKILKALEA
ncbi:MAG: deoxyribose-phosphate aldolase [Ruminococcaceae bacterium]|nr:deoxyribose-phosphate aldolase [Oscillospiraceae bacterium]